MGTRPPIDYIARTREQYAALDYPVYQWVENPDPPAFVALAKPLAESRVALIGSGGIYQLGQIAFHFKDDFSFREIDTRVPTSELRATHFAYDLTDAREDPNVVFPIDTLHDAVEQGWIGSISPRAYAFMGGIYSSRKVRDILAPALVQRMHADEVDLALLVPVWPVCHQSVGLIARAIEASGIPTLTMSSARSITAAVNPPRAVYLDYPLGHTAGKPNAPAEQLAILRQTLDAFTAIKSPGEIIDLPFEWRADDAWKDTVMRPRSRAAKSAAARGAQQTDDRVARHATPQYQSADDERAADPNCPTCVFPIEQE